jgi:hypothetical protein
LIGGQTVELPQSEIPGEALTFSGRFQQTVNLADATREPLQAASEPTTLSPDLASEDEQDLIVVEDDPPEPNPPAPMPPQVRRQEYRQLFARLRRG